MSRLLIYASFRFIIRFVINTNVYVHYIFFITHNRKVGLKMTDYNNTFYP